MSCFCGPQQTRHTGNDRKQLPGAEDNPLTIVTLANAITLSGGTRKTHARRRRRD